MKRLFFLLAILAMTSLFAGCGRSWSSWWMPGNNVSACAPCNGTLGGDGGVLLPPPTSGPVLPGPAVEAVPSQ